MLAGLIAIILAAAFCGAATYINVAEHPARMLLGDAEALAQWGPSYDRAFNYQGGLAVASGLAGLAQAWLVGDWHWAHRCRADARELALYAGGNLAAEPPIESAARSRS